jgi:hypothetical protein
MPARPDAAALRRWGIEPEWSTVVDVPDRNGRVQQWHVLDHGPADPIATLVCVHGNPTWSYLWVDVMARLGQR